MTTYSLTYPHLSPQEFLDILVSPDVWDAQALDGVEKPTEFPFGQDCLAYALREDGELLAYLLFVPIAPGIYEQHSCIPETHRGKWETLIRLAHEAMFLETDATMIVTLCPDWLPYLTKVASRFGGKRMWRKDFLGTIQTVPYGATMMGLTVMDWAWRVHMDYAEVGHEWHEAAFKDGAEPHEDDAAHDGFVGLALKMSVKQPLKAQQVYNTWAQTAGYWPLTILWSSEGNSLIDIGSSVILNKGGKFAAAIPKSCQ